MRVPSLLWSALGSTRASTEVLSQIEPTPGAVTAAQALPEEFSPGAPGEIFCCSRSPLVAPCGGLTTVMSAPMRVSQNGEIDCLTDTEDAPLPLALEDHAAESLAAFFAAGRPLAEGAFSVDASTLSWLQSSLSMSTSLRRSSSFLSGAAAVSSSTSAASSDAGGVCAIATAENRPKPAASASSPSRRIDVLDFMTSARLQQDLHAVILAQNCGGPVAPKSRMRLSHAEAASFLSDKG